MLLQIRHETLYEYEEPVSYSIQALKLTPRGDPGQRVINWRVQTPGERLEQIDAFGNIMQFVTVEVPHRSMHIVVEGAAELDECAAQLPPEPGALSPVAYLAPTLLTRPDAALRALAERHLGRHPASARSLMDLVAGIREAVVHDPGMSGLSNGAGEALDLGAGGCRERTHVMVACCRAAGIPARYVSGYFHAAGQAEIESHAWADVWLGPDEGWLSLDLTHAGPAGPHHCRLAVGRDHLDAAPVRSVRRGGGRQSTKVTLRIAGPQGQQQ